MSEIQSGSTRFEVMKRTEHLHEMILILRSFDRSDDVVVRSMDLVVVIDSKEVRL